MKSLRAFPALTTSVATLAIFAGPAAAANPQIVSRLDGAAGTPIPAELGRTAADGRLVVLHAKSAAIAAQLGVEQPAKPGQFYLRDRTAGTTVELNLRATPGGAPATQTWVLDVSDDGKRVLFNTGDPAFAAAVGLPATGSSYNVVADVGGGNVWVLRDAKGDPTREAALLSGDGRSAIIRGFKPDDEQYAVESIQRAYVDKPSEPIVVMPEDNGGYAYVQGASDDLQTVLYSRQLEGSARPVSVGDTSWTATSALGLSTPQGNRIIVQGEAVEVLENPGGQCDIGNLRVRTTAPSPLAISADGQRVSYVLGKSSISQSPGDEGRSDGASSIVVGPGGLERTTATVTSETANQVWPRTLGATHDLFVESSVKPMNWNVPELDDYGTGYTVRSASASGFKVSGGGLQNRPSTFADGDRTVLWDSGTQLPFEGQTPPTSLPYVYAEAVTGTLPPAPSGASLWSQGIPDTPDLPSKVTWNDCEVQYGAGPVAPAALYAGITLRSPVIASASAGKVAVDLAPPGYRRASKVALEYKVFGLSIWRRSTIQGEDIALPKPPLWLPVTLTATVSPLAADEGGPAPKPIVVSRSIFASR